MPAKAAQSAFDVHGRHTEKVDITSQWGALGFGQSLFEMHWTQLWFGAHFVEPPMLNDEVQSASVRHMTHLCCEVSQGPVGAQSLFDRHSTIVQVPPERQATRMPAPCEHCASVVHGPHVFVVGEQPMPEAQSLASLQRPYACAPPKLAAKLTPPLKALAASS